MYLGRGQSTGEGQLSACLTRGNHKEVRLNAEVNMTDTGLTVQETASSQESQDSQQTVPETTIDGETHTVCVCVCVCGGGGGGGSVPLY